jgi:hypothetical protein
MLEAERQATIDGEHLRILSICYIVYAGFNAFFSLFGLLYAFMGVFVNELISRMPPQPNQPPPPEFLGLFFGVFGFGMFGLMVVLAVLKFIVANRLRQRRSRALCLVVAGLTCFGIPFGTALGVFTFLVLLRPSVALSFDTQTSSAGSVVPTGGGA